MDGRQQLMGPVVSEMCLQRLVVAHRTHDTLALATGTAFLVPV